MKSPWLWLVVSVLLVPALRAQETRDLDLGGAIAVDDDETPAPQQPRPDSVEDLPLDQQPLPAADSPKYVAFLWKRAELWHGRGRYLKACADLDRLRAAGESLEPQKAMAGRAYLACALKAAEKKEVEQAEQLLQLSIGLIGEVPENKRVHGSLARHESEAALARGDMQAAIEAFDRASTLEPDKSDKLKFSTNLAYLARTAEEAGDTDKAKQAASEALRYFADNFEAQDILRQIWFRDHFALMVGGAFALLAVLVALFVLWRRAAASKFARIDPDLLPDLDVDDPSADIDDDLDEEL